MKPSLHELICDYLVKTKYDDNVTIGEQGEQIIKIVRDYHLVEDKPKTLEELRKDYLQKKSDWIKTFQKKENK